MGMGSNRKWAANLDMYRKVPVDLLEGSREGSFVSWVAIVTILILFLRETADYFTTTIAADLRLDRQSSSPKDFIRVNLNITMMDLKCDYVEIDVVNFLGTNQNVIKSINKFPVDAQGVLNMYAARNHHQNDIEVEMHDKKVTKSIEELHESGEEAISLDQVTFQFALRENDLVFVDFFASWCSHCRLLAPTWEVLAKVMNDALAIEEAEKREDALKEIGEEGPELKEAEKLDIPVLIAKVDCVTHHDFCNSQGISAYPTLRLFVKGERFNRGDYRGHRTVMDMIEFLVFAEFELKGKGALSKENINAALEKHLDMSPEEEEWSEAVARNRHRHQQPGWDPDKHPGCNIVGWLMMNRVPGHFFLQAFSPYHDLVPHMTNVSHEIHHLEFLPPNPVLLKRTVLPPNFQLQRSTRPMDGNVYLTHNLHEAFHHYMKLITTNGNSYQVLQSSQLAVYQAEEVPEAKFIIDFSPIAVSYRKVSRHWYDYITSLMAIIGGTFTVVGFFEAGIRRVSRRVSKEQRKSPY